MVGIYRMFETCWEAKSSIKLRRIEGWASNPPIFGAGDGRFLIRKGKCSHISALGFDSTVKVVECKMYGRHMYITTASFAGKPKSGI